MPTKTFFNLDQEKRTRIVDQAIYEFSRRSYRNANIANIASKADVSKGSMYQYFKNKEDLYSYLISYGIELKLENFQDHMKDIENQTFMEVLRLLYREGVKFALKHKSLAKLFINFTKEHDLPIKNKLMDKGLKESNKILCELLRKGKAKGQINEIIDEEMTATLLSTLDIYIVETVLNDLDNDNITDQMDIYIKKVDKMLDLFEYGLKAR